MLYDFQSQKSKGMNLRWQTRRRQRKNTWILKVYFIPPICRSRPTSAPSCDESTATGRRRSSAISVRRAALSDRSLNLDGCLYVRFFVFGWLFVFFGMFIVFDFNDGPVWVGLKISYLSTG